MAQLETAYAKRASDPANRRPPRLCGYCGNQLADGVDARTKYHGDCYKQLSAQRTRTKIRLHKAGLPSDAKAIAAELAKHRPKVGTDPAVHQALRLGGNAARR